MENLVYLFVIDQNFRHLPSSMQIMAAAFVGISLFMLHSLNKSLALEFAVLIPNLLRLVTAVESAAVCEAEIVGDFKTVAIRVVCRSGLC